MDEMLALLGEHKSCMLFEQLFLERLPEEIRTQLVADKIDDHREMARKADQLWAARDASSTPAAHSVQRGKPNSRKIKSNTAEESPDNSQLYAIIIADLVKPPANADNHVAGRETPRPTASGRSGWP